MTGHTHTDKPNSVTLAVHARQGLTRRTKVQNPRRKILHLAYYTNARARKLATPHVVAVNAWCCQFSLQHGLVTSVGIVLDKAECC